MGGFGAVISEQIGAGIRSSLTNSAWSSINTASGMGVPVTPWGAAATAVGENINRSHEAAKIKALFGDMTSEINKFDSALKKIGYSRAEFQSTMRAIGQASLQTGQELTKGSMQALESTRAYGVSVESLIAASAGITKGTGISAVQLTQGLLRSGHERPALDATIGAMAQVGAMHSELGVQSPEMVSFLGDFSARIGQESPQLRGGANVRLANKFVEAGINKHWTTMISTPWKKGQSYADWQIEMEQNGYKNSLKFLTGMDRDMAAVVSQTMGISATQMDIVRNANQRTQSDFSGVTGGSSEALTTEAQSNVGSAAKWGAGIRQLGVKDVTGWSAATWLDRKGAELFPWAVRGGGVSTANAAEAPSTLANISPNVVGGTLNKNDPNYVLAQLAHIASGGIAQITSGVRAKDHPDSRKNPRSLHIAENGAAAIDVRIPSDRAEAANLRKVFQQLENDYGIKFLDESNKPGAPHFHLQYANKGSIDADQARLMAAIGQLMVQNSTIQRNK